MLTLLGWPTLKHSQWHGRRMSHGRHTDYEWVSEDSGAARTLQGSRPVSRCRGSAERGTCCGSEVSGGGRGRLSPDSPGGAR